MYEIARGQAVQLKAVWAGAIAIVERFQLMDRSLLPSTLLVKEDLRQAYWEYGDEDIVVDHHSVFLRTSGEVRALALRDALPVQDNLRVFHKVSGDGNHRVGYTCEDDLRGPEVNHIVRAIVLAEAIAALQRRL